MLRFAVPSVLMACVASPDRTLADLALPATTTQVLLSTTADWDDTAATVQRFERTESVWRAIGGPIAARVGRSGLGWGIGRHFGGEGPTKREGDGRAPAGIFEVGPAFGYAQQPPVGVTMPYRVATERDYFVDAVDSPDYNQWRRIPEGDPNDPKARWSSCERMRRDDDVYEFGLVVHHNMTDAVPGRGSAIFVHVWSGPDNPTSGCTAMSRGDVLQVLEWLRSDANPLLIQVPRSEFTGLQVAMVGLFHNGARAALRSLGIDRRIVHTIHLPMALNRLAIELASENPEVDNLSITLVEMTNGWQLQSPAQADLHGWLERSR